MSFALRRAAGRRVDLGDLQLHVVEEGRGPAVLFLHGFTGCVESLGPLAASVREAGFRTLRLDLVGHGRSDAPDDASCYRMERCTADVGRVLDALRASPAHVVGYSMGGRVALSLAVHAPARVRSLVTIGASAGIEEPLGRAARVAADDSLAGSIEAEGIEAFVERWMAQPLFASQRRLGGAAIATERRLRRKNRPFALAHSLRGMGAGAQPPLHAALGGLRVPALLVAGSADAKFTAIARDLADRIPGAAVAVVPGAGHAVHLEQPVALAALLRGFLTRCEKESP